MEFQYGAQKRLANSVVIEEGNPDAWLKFNLI